MYVNKHVTSSKLKTHLLIQDKENVHDEPIWGILTENYRPKDE